MGGHSRPRRGSCLEIGSVAIIGSAVLDAEVHSAQVIDESHFSPPLIVGEFVQLPALLASIGLDRPTERAEQRRSLALATPAVH